MKKTLLIGAAIAVGFSGLAQNNRQPVNSWHRASINKGSNQIDPERFPTSGTKRTGLGANPNAVCQPVWYSSGPNAFGVGGGVTTYKQNCFSYNKDLNSYVWTHRRSTGWAGAQPMSSGSMQSTWWTPSTGAKDSTILYYEAATTNPGRYPTGTFYNPAGNTTWSNVWVVGSGPDLPGGSAFTGTWYATRQLTGTSADHNVPGTDLNWISSPSSVLGSTVFMNYDMQQVGTRVLVGGEATDTTTSTNTNNIPTFGGIIGKVSGFAGGTPTWSYDSIIPGYYFNRNGAGNGYATDYQEGGRIAFFGNTGYWVGKGRLATNYNNSADSMMSPIIYKTTDGGLTWNGPLLPGYDWNCKHPELGLNTGELFTTKPRHFMMDYKHGFDVTVDGNGTLHIVGTMVTPYRDGAYPDSVAFYYTYSHDYINHHPIIWDMMTDGTQWSTMMVDSIITSYVGQDPATDTTASFSAVTNGTTFLNYGARAQVSRSSDGTKIFYSWADSDPSVTGNAFNSQPDLFQKAWDLTQNKVTPTIPVTNGLGVCFFHMMADQAYQDGSNAYHMPMMYTLPRGGSGGIYDGTAPSDHFLVDCVTYTSVDFTMPAPIHGEPATGCTAIGVQSHNTFASSVSNYPNPFSNSTNIVVNLGEAKAISVNVFDALGNMVFSKKVNGNVGANTITVDGSSLSAGVYHYSVTAGSEKVTKKMIVQK